MESNVVSLADATTIGGALKVLKEDQQELDALIVSYRKKSGEYGVMFANVGVEDCAYMITLLQWAYQDYCGVTTEVQK